jgi:Domain of unknown function (DUF5666)
MTHLTVEEELHDGFDDDLLDVPKRRLFSRVGLCLVALVIAAGGFVGGIYVTQQTQDSGSSLPGGIELPEGVELPEGFQIPDGATLPNAGGGGGLGGLPGLGGGAGNGTIGTVSLVDGNTLYIRDRSGATVKVELEDKATVRSLRRGSLADLRPGDTVSIDGTTETTGKMRASSITQTQTAQ